MKILNVKEIGMGFVKNLENTVAGWLKPVPHLPKAAQKWIAENVWWIVLIGVVLSAIGLLVSLAAFLGALALVGTYYGGALAVSGYTGGGWVLSGILSLIFTVGLITLLATAISPLKAMKKKGWTLLFLITLLDAVYVVLSAVLSLSVIGFIFGIIFGAIGLAIALYLLFEIRSYFVAVKSEHAKK